MRTRTVRQVVVLPGPPMAVYRALMTTAGHEGFTESPAKISPRVGGTFTAWDGYIHGTNLELVPARRIVQAWRATEEGWPETHFSKVTFLLEPARAGTRLTFRQSGVPVGHADEIAKGWKEFYWEPLKRYLAEQGP